MSFFIGMEQYQKTLILAIILNSPTSRLARTGNNTKRKCEPTKSYFPNRLWTARDMNKELICPHFLL